MKIKQAHNHDPHQAALFNQERAVARRDAPETSKAAARSVKKIRASHELILHMIRQCGPMTDYELRDRAAEEGFKISWSGMSARRGELCPPRGRGLRDSGKTRATPNGRAATVWEIDPNVEPEVPPAKIRNLRPSQRLVYDLFEKYGKLTHQALYQFYAASTVGDEEVMTESGIRSRCAELVALKLVERKEDAPGKYGQVSVWGLV